METSIESYFWMVDRLGLEDDQQNKVNIADKTVTLSKHFTKKLTNGFFIGKLLIEMHPTFIKRTKKIFKLNPALTDLKDNDGPSNRKISWNLIMQTLGLYKIALDEKRQKTVLEGSTATIKEVVDGLFEIDNSASGQLAPENPLRSEPFKMKKVQPPDEEKSFDRDLSVLDKTTEAPTTTAPTARTKSQSGVLTQRRNRLKLDPLVTKEQDENVFGELQSPTAARLKQNAGRPGQSQNASRIQAKNATTKQKKQNLSDIEFEWPQNLDQTESTLQFIVLSLSQAFKLTIKQAAALIANNQKLLFQVCIKGMKNTGFQNVLDWYELVNTNSHHLVDLATNVRSQEASLVKPKQTRQVKKTLNILKAGFYSMDVRVVTECGELFLKMGNELISKGPECIEEVWDWLVNSLPKPEPKKQLSAKKPTSTSRNVTSRHAKSLKPIEIESITEPLEEKDEVSTDFSDLLFHTGLQAVIQAVYCFETTFAKLGTQILLLYGEFNQVELFTQKLQQQMLSWSDYAQFCLIIFLQTKDIDNVFEIKGVLKYWTLVSLRVAESSGEVTLDDRIISLVLVTEILMEKSEYISSTLEGATNTILGILKRAARDVRQTLCLISLELLFRLLAAFARLKNQSAPLIYKTLTFLMVEFYWEVEVREIMLRHFIELFSEFPSIPVAILCEPLLKQVQISQYQSASFNVFDFEFFQTIVVHKKITVSVALLLKEALTKIALQSVFFSQLALDTLKPLITRFKKSPECFSHWQTSFRQILVQLMNIQTVLQQNEQLKNIVPSPYNNMVYAKKPDSQKKQSNLPTRLPEAELRALKTSERLIVRFLMQVVDLKHQLINDELRQQLTDTYLGLKVGLQIESKPVCFLLKKFGYELDDLVEQRILQNPQASVQMLQQPEIHVSLSATLIPDTQDQKDQNSPNVKEEVSFERSGKKAQSPRSPRVPRSSKKNNQILAVKSSRNEHTLIVASRLARTPVLKLTLPSKLYEYVELEEDIDVAQYFSFIERNQKLYRELFTHYSMAGRGAAKRYDAYQQKTFDIYGNMQVTISTLSLVKIIQDFQFGSGRNGALATQNKDEIKHLVKLLNEKDALDGTSVRTTDLPFENFIEFIVQVSHLLFNTYSKIDPVHHPIDFIEGSKNHITAVNLVTRFWKHLNDFNESKNLGLNLIGGDFQTAKVQEAIDKLEQRLAANPEADLPAGFTKVTEKNYVQLWKVPEGPIFSEAQVFAIEFLDDLFRQKFGFHILEGTCELQDCVKVRPTKKATTILRSQSQRQKVSRSPKESPRNSPTSRPKINLKPAGRSTVLKSDRSRASLLGSNLKSNLSDANENSLSSERKTLVQPKFKMAFGKKIPIAVEKNDMIVVPKTETDEEELDRLKEEQARKAKLLKQQREKVQQMREQQKEEMRQKEEQEKLESQRTEERRLRAAESREARMAEIRDQRVAYQAELRQKKDEEKLQAEQAAGEKKRVANQKIAEKQSKIVEDIQGWRQKRLEEAEKKKLASQPKPLPKQKRTTSPSRSPPRTTADETRISPKSKPEVEKKSPSPRKSKSPPPPKTESVKTSPRPQRVKVQPKPKNVKIEPDLQKEISSNKNSPRKNTFPKAKPLKAQPIIKQESERVPEAGKIEPSPKMINNKLGSKPNFNSQKKTLSPIINLSSIDHDDIPIEVTTSPSQRNRLGYDFNENHLKEVATPSNKQLTIALAEAKLEKPEKTRFMKLQSQMSLNIDDIKSDSYSEIE